MKIKIVDSIVPLLLTRDDETGYLVVENAGFVVYDAENMDLVPISAKAASEPQEWWRGGSRPDEPKFFFYVKWNENIISYEHSEPLAIWPMNYKLPLIRIGNDKLRPLLADERTKYRDKRYKVFIGFDKIGIPEYGYHYILEHLYPPDHFLGANYIVKPDKQKIVAQAIEQLRRGKTVYLKEKCPALRKAAKATTRTNCPLKLVAYEHKDNGVAVTSQTFASQGKPITKVATSFLPVAT